MSSSRSAQAVDFPREARIGAGIDHLDVRQAPVDVTKTGADIARGPRRVGAYPTPEFGVLGIVRVLFCIAQISQSPGGLGVEEVVFQVGLSGVGPVSNEVIGPDVVGALRPQTDA